MRGVLAFIRDASGATAVEFGIVSLPLFLTILFLMSIGYISFIVQGLDLTAKKVARQVRIGAVQSMQLSQQQFLTQVVCPVLPPTVQCANVIVNLQNVAYTNGNAYNYNSYNNFVNSSQTGLIIPPLSNSQTSYCPGQGGTNPSYVYLQILYPVSYFLALFAPASATVYNGQKVFLVMSTATFLNEPFVAPASAC